MIVRATGPWPYASSLRTTRRRAEPAGHDGERAVLRVAEDRDGCPGDGLRSGSGRRRSPGTRSSARSFLRSNATTVAGGAARAPTCDDGVLLPGDDVRRGDDERRRDDPAAAGDPQAARRPEHAHDARRRAPHAGRVEQRRIGRRDRRERSRDARERIDAREDLHHARRRQRGVEPLQDERLLRRAAQVLLTRDEQRRRADDPDEREPRGGAEHEAAGRVERAQRRQRQRAARHARRGRPRAVSNSTAPNAAPASPASGVYGELEPPVSSCGASRAPTIAPTTMPVTESALAMSPFL